MPKDRLIIATDLTLSVTDVIWIYARRWPIESMFNQAKNRQDSRAAEGPREKRGRVLLAKKDR
jgi:hypothetical protein